jgi:hypothetical protein
MRHVFFLVFGKRGIKKAMKRRPTLNNGEVAVKITAEISDRFFERMIPSAVMSIPDSHVIEPRIDMTINNPGVVDNEHRRS